MLAVLLGFALSVLLLWSGAAIPARANPDTCYVALPPLGVDAGNNCTNPITPCATIQRAIDMAVPGDDIRIAGGTYTSTAGTVAVITKSVILEGGYPADFSGHDPGLYQTVLDAQGGGSVISVTNAGAVTLQFLTLTHGDGNGNCGGLYGCGGGVYATNTSLHVGNCVIMDNLGNTAGAGFGGGIFVDNWFNPAPVEIWESQFENNAAGTTGIGLGGGLHLIGGDISTPVIINGNTFAGNAASTISEGQGGGLYLVTTPGAFGILSHNTFYSNHGSRSAGLGSGGGLYLFLADGITLEANQFIGNTASAFGDGYGGAIYMPYEAVFTMTNNVLAQNHASRGGGGLCLDTFGFITGTLVNNTLVDNDVGAGGEGIWVGHSVSLVLTNNIIAGHTVGITNTMPASSTISADTNLFWNTSDPITGTNGIRQDPLLTPDHHPGSGSPALDTGLTVPWLTVDLADVPRPQGSGYDMGAFEGAASGPTGLKVYLPLILRNKS